MNRYRPVLKRDVSLEIVGADLRVRAGERALSLPARTRLVAETVRGLATGKVDEDPITEALLAAEGHESLCWVYWLLRQIQSHNLLDYILVVDGFHLATVEPLCAGFVFAAADPRRHRVLSRFAYVRAVEGQLVLESPLSTVRIVLHAPIVFSKLVCGAGSRNELGPSAAPETPDAQLLAMEELLVQTGFFVDRDETESDARCTWEFHDRLFHRSSRAGRGSIGATYRFAGRLPPWPAQKPQMSAHGISLAVPDIEQLARVDCTLTQALESRRSVRRVAGSMTAGALAQFLYRSAAIRASCRQGPEETLRRVYPSGGAIHELEFYPLINTCDGLEAGLYHYNAGSHSLHRTPATGLQCERLLDSAAAAMGDVCGRPAILVNVTARLPRIAWKYEGMAYRTVLLNAGAVLQTMYLVATAMDLGPCAVGNGDPELLAAAAGIDGDEEVGVAEFALSGGATG
jgi:SagB-type dehydrogenase family enzyme